MSNENDAKNMENMPQEGPGQKGERQFVTVRQITFNRKPGYVLRKVGQAYMVMPTGPRMKDYQGMITLNETGAFLFKQLDMPEPDRSKLIQACIDEYGATPEEAAQAVDSFAQQCADCGLLETQEVIFDSEGGRMTRDEFEQLVQQRREQGE